MRKMSLHVALVFLLAIYLQADEKQIEDHLKQQLVGKIVTLRGFYQRDTVEYDRQGVPKFKAESGPWTLFGRVELTGFKFKKDKLSIRGNRILVAWPKKKDGSSRLEYYRYRPLLIEADLDAASSDEAAINRMLARIFLTSKDHLEDLVAAYWHDYLAAKNNLSQSSSGTVGTVNGSNHSPVSGTTETLSSNPVLGGQAKASGTFTGGQLIKKVEPDYPPVAKAAHLSGDLVFLATIGKDGLIKALSVQKPLGLGAEESAFEAISKWKYQPYMLNNDPVEVKTVITIRYVLAGG